MMVTSHETANHWARLLALCNGAGEPGTAVTEKPERPLRAAGTLTPPRTATEEDTRVLLRSLAELRAALMLAGKEIVKLNFGKRDTELLKMIRERLREAKQVAARFAPAGKDE
jgi:hypothetical protein